MTFKNLSVKRLFGWIVAGLFLSMAVITLSLFFITKQTAVLLTGGVLLLCALIWLFLLTQIFGKRLSAFTSVLCQTLDHMIEGHEAPLRPEDSETMLARICYRLSRLYQIMQENRRKVDEERRELQSLISDISHQVKTPIANLKMINSTLMEQEVPLHKQKEFLSASASQLDKLDFLMQAMIKTSRLETGVISLDKKKQTVYDTLASALGGILLNAEKKQIDVSVNCPEHLAVPHDRKWTSEALFNILDNAVKYTPENGKITVTVECWELYLKISIADTGKGIPEKHQGAIFKRFYREDDIHDIEGIGIGLYLAREIITMQGGYIKLTSSPDIGSCFMVFLPRD